MSGRVNKIILWDMVSNCCLLDLRRGQGEMGLNFIRRIWAKYKKFLSAELTRWGFWKEMVEFSGIVFLECCWCNPVQGERMRENHSSRAHLTPWFFKLRWFTFSGVDAEVKRNPCGYQLTWEQGRRGEVVVKKIYHSACVCVCNTQEWSQAWD